MVYVLLGTITVDCLGKNLKIYKKDIKQSKTETIKHIMKKAACFMEQ